VIPLIPTSWQEEEETRGGGKQSVKLENFYCEKSTSYFSEGRGKNGNRTNGFYNFKRRRQQRQERERERQIGNDDSCWKGIDGNYRRKKLFQSIAALLNLD
jgi:hypothetical protein